ncbi:MAG: DNA primase [Bacteroidaceae bacterium]|nr:DNA primase [Bacteroidaceae bacterium]
MIDRATVDKIMDAANIVDVVSDFVTLRRAGANLKGLCPFHDDRTPSFMVSPAKNYCKCFACGKGGNPVGFIMEHEQLSYPEALRYLARKYGIPIEEKELTPEERQSQGDRDSMFIVNEWARDWFRHQLLETDDGRAIGLAYFRGRGFRDDIIQRFQLGYCPDSRTQSMAADALKAGYQEKYLVNTIDEREPKNSVGTGLCIKNENGSWRDRFRGRVIWPIFTISGRVAGFGGRVLDAATKGVNVKYLNSPESIIYSKRKELFGLYQAKEAIRRQDLCYLVEGYTDVMAMHQMGVENVVASSGTALTTDQIRLIHRMTANITVIFDGDEAGIHASERGIDMLLAEGMDVKLLLLPDGDDPDSFARKHNATEYQEYLKTHQVDFIHFKTNLLIKEANGDTTKLNNLINKIVESIAAIPEAISRDLYVHQAAEQLQAKEDLIAEAVKKQIRKIQDEKRREEERKERIGISTENHKETEGKEEESSKPILTNFFGPSLDIFETPIMQMLVRYGEQPMGVVEDEEGHEISLTVVEYIHYSLDGDNTQFHNPLYRQMLAEAMQHIKDDNFAAEHYFLSHPDPRINSLAFDLSTDREQLSRLHGQPAATHLAEAVPPLVACLKLAHVRSEMKQLIEQTKKTELLKDRDAFRKLMARYNDLKHLSEQLAREAGDQVVLR